MRTTLNIDDDLLRATKELARLQNLSSGEIVSKLLRQALTGRMVLRSDPETSKNIGGFRPFTSNDAELVTNEQVNSLRDQLGI